MAEAPGFNILHLKCWARARARNAKQLAEYRSSHPPPSITIPFPFRLRLDLKRANLSSTTRDRVFHFLLCDRDVCVCVCVERVREACGHGGPHLNLKSALHNARPRRCTSTPGPPNCGLVRAPCPFDTYSSHSRKTGSFRPPSLSLASATLNRPTR